ncbi:hypothetical protein A2U01_0005590, partial [Trifolium medium]|nr:hypothetical protein [Trifolium medium]
MSEESEWHIFFGCRHVEQKRCKYVNSLLWCLWKRRNEKVWEDANKPVIEMLLIAEIRILEAITATDIAVRGGAETERAETGLSWCKLVTGELKCNVDATIFEQCGHGVGMCIRNEK